VVFGQTHCLRGAKKRICGRVNSRDDARTAHQRSSHAGGQGRSVCTCASLDSTIRESPQLATDKRSPRMIATEAVQPQEDASPRNIYWRMNSRDYLQVRNLQLGCFCTSQLFLDLAVQLAERRLQHALAAPAHLALIALTARGRPQDSAHHLHR